MDFFLQDSHASFWGEDTGDYSGYSVAGAGDVNGDGYDDILIGAYLDEDGGVSAGQTYLILGKPSGWFKNFDLSAADASFWGEDTGDDSGYSVDGAGDVNGDGYDDILIGAVQDDDGGNSAGQTYLIFGKPSGWAMDTDLSAANASFWGEDADDYSGISVAGAGDVNWDGYDDILIGAYGDDDGGIQAGQTYLILGKPLGWAMDTDLSAADASFWGEDADDVSGYSVAGAGDVNGDGYDDMLIGAYGDEESAPYGGQTYLIFGKPSGTWAMDTSLSAADASFWGENAGDYSGFSVAGAGDVNGDGYDDVLIGAYGNDGGGVYEGQTYLIFGKPSGWAMDASLSAASASFWGEGDFDISGHSVAGAGDVNGDGYDDILIGADGDDDGGNSAGQTYLIFGKPSGWAMDTDLSAADASFWGEGPDDYSGFSVAGAGDVNGYGHDDILIGAYGNDDGGAWRGQTYLIFSETEPDAPTNLQAALSQDGAFLNLTWDAAEFWQSGVGGGGIAGYRVYRSEDGISYHEVAVLSGTTLYYNDTDVILGHMYRYAVTAISGVWPYDDSPKSIPVEVLCDYDTDLDGIGNVVDTNDDGDGASDGADSFPLDPSEWLDTDRDGIGNSADPDDDNDGVLDSSDFYPLNPLNDIPIKIDLLSLQLSGVNDSLISRVSNAEGNILSALAGLNASLSLDIQTLLASITNEVVGLNASISDQLTNLLNSMTTDHDALGTWLGMVLGQIDANLTTTGNTLQTQLTSLDASMTGFYNNLQGDIGNILAELQLHDDASGENHTVIKDMLNIIMASAGVAGIQEIKDMMTYLAGNLSAHNQSIANGILNVVADIDAFQTETNQSLEDIDATMANMAKLDDILGNLTALDQSLERAEQELGSSIGESGDREASKLDTSTMLLIVILVLVIVSMMINLTGRRRPAEAPARRTAEKESSKGAEEETGDQLEEEEEVDEAKG